MAKVTVPLDSFNGISYANMSERAIAALDMFPPIKAGYDLWFARNEGKRYVASITKSLEDLLEGYSYENGNHTPVKYGTYRVDMEVVEPNDAEEVLGVYYTLTLQVGDKRGPLTVTPAASSGTRAPNGAKKCMVDGETYDSIAEALRECEVDIFPAKSLSTAAGVARLIKAGHSVQLVG